MSWQTDPTAGDGIVRFGAAAVPVQRYAEDHVAANWRFQAVGSYVPVLAVALFAGAVASQLNWLVWISVVALGLAVVPAMVGNWLFCMWPAGIRLDDDGVRIGGVRWSERHPGRVRARTAIPPRQYSQVFACPWDGIRGIGVTTDRQVLGSLRRDAGYRAAGYRGYGYKPVLLGNLAAPFMRAALVIGVDVSRAQLPEIRAPRNPFWWKLPGRGHNQPLWVVPTRRPAELRAALAAVPQAAAIVADPAEIIRTIRA